MSIKKRPILCIIAALIIFTFAITLTVNADFNQGYWPNKKVYYYISSSVPSSKISLVRSGVNSWPNNTIFKLRETTNPTTFDMYVNMTSYGATGWVGHCNILPNDYTAPYTYAGVQLNTSYPDQGGTYWQAVTAHETGHATGLAHTSNQNTKSIMNYLWNTYWYSWHLVGPTTYDITNVNARYTDVYSLSSKSSLAAIPTKVSYASWYESFKSFENMVENADVIVKGNVDQSVPEQRNDLIFTMQKIKINKEMKGDVNKNDTISVLQTGGNLNNISTPAIDDAPLLTKEDNYILFLKYVDSGEYGKYYLIMGGYQGVGEIKNNNIKALYKDSPNLLINDRNEDMLDKQIEKEQDKQKDKALDNQVVQ